MPQKESCRSAGFRCKLQTAALRQIETIEYSHHRADLRASQRFHHGPGQIPRSPHGDVEDLLQLHSIGQQTEWVQGTVGCDVEDVTLVPSQP